MSEEETLIDRIQDFLIKRTQGAASAVPIPASQVSVVPMAERERSGTKEGA